MLLVLFKRFLRKSTSAEAVENERKLSPEQCVARIRQGDELLREQFIADYKPYILKVTSRFCKRYIDQNRDDEFSVALLAYNEAINQFDSDAGKSFIGFSETVIRRRLIDHVRKEQRHAQTIPYSMFDSEDGEQPRNNSVESWQAMASFEIKRTEDERRLEIGELNQELMKFGISFAELVENSPKHADSRRLLIGIAQTLVSHSDLMDSLREKSKLAVKELTELCGVSRKTIERNRKYIIAISIIISGTYPYMHDYLNIAGDQIHTNKEASK
ncbi:RNA polymerase sigma-I factor [Paenibacillus sp. FSL H8-0548]|uniref:RNA polymerase sigma factor SigI n=1 Tax=Paenibacillus sp. FSL H8-0548 TaxID=1920422 RepID=UPI00096D06F4|nr:RNA polymerase sigma factor SigI [Paenibacillus sp. FSL H8-0548]OMF38690.1 RNA polymerase sigma-I factor [Paenibacillus sp. FSL H8-0548]